MEEFNQIIEKGIVEVWDSDCEVQSEFLHLIENVRGMGHGILKELRAFFVPNDAYLALRFGEGIKTPDFDCYVGSLCKWNNCLVMPIRNAADNAVGLVGFNPFQYLKNRESNDWTTPYYKYSNAYLFPKGKHVFAPGGIAKALEEGYVFVVDGIFDAISLWHRGFNAWALMDSSLTRERIVLLRSVKRVILVADNDDAGVKLYKQMRQKIRGVELIKQGKTKDIDELLKTDFAEKTVQKLRNLVSGSAGSIVKLDFEN